MEINKIKTLLNKTSPIGINFDIISISELTDIPLCELINFFNSDKGQKIFEKIDETTYKYKDPKFKSQLLLNITQNNKTKIKSSYKKALINLIQNKSLQLLINENEKIKKDRILSFFLYFTYYLINLDFLDLAEKNVDFIIQRIYNKTEDYEKALLTKAHILFLKKEYSQSIKLLDKINIFPEQILRKFNFLATIYSNLGENENYEQNFKEWEKFNQFMIFFNRARINLNKANFLINKTEYKTAKEFLNNIQDSFLDAEKEFNYPYLYILIGDFYNLYGLTLFYQENYNEAKSAFLKSIEYFKKAEFDRELLIPYNNIAEIEKHSKQYKKAINIYKNIINLAKSIGNRDSYGLALWNIGELYYDLKNYEKAEIYFKKGDNILKKSGIYLNFKNVFNLYFAKLYFHTNRFNESENLINDILLNTYEIGEKRTYAEALLYKGRLLAHRGESAKSYFEEAETIFKELDIEELLTETKKLKLMYY